LDDTFIARPAGVVPILQQGNGSADHAGGPVTDVHFAVGQYAQQSAEIPREGVGAHGLALDDAGIAEGSFTARLAAIYQRYVVAATGKVPGNGNADHTGAKDEGVTRHE